MPDFLILHSSGRYIDTRPVDFHGYTVQYDGTVLSKRGLPMKFEKRARRGAGNKFDLCVRLYYNGKSKKWTVTRLIGACFLGNIDGMEMNHLARNPELVGADDIEISTRSQNQIHWRNDNKENVNGI